MKIIATGTIRTNPTTNKHRPGAWSARSLGALLLALVLMGTASCGFLHNPRVGKAYADSEFFEGTIDSCTGALITWPVHIVIFTITSVVDQTIHTFVQLNNRLTLINFDDFTSHQ